MRCPRCSYELTDSDRLLCRVVNVSYCPHCWARIDASGEPLGSVASTDQGRGKNRGRIPTGAGRTHE